ncbi:NADH-quinone oxidoreductase subunit C [Candidatus Tisiphia endosymbiont of Nemotelus uliginosus]|uniref:NADH-quinone oxidoreductase subunit C n=1 Tax=Candidatus Tisiphia endosymbiont of Nemotelus uliginosus TaxID=3077926 RepID=UPI0035C93520
MEEIIDKLIKNQELEIAVLPVQSNGSNIHFAAYKSTIESLLPFLSSIKQSENLRFTVLTDLFAADFLDRLKRFEVVYNLLSLKLNKRILVKVEVGENDIIPSITKIFSAACWYEREVYDMFGVNFAGSHDIRRILTDYDFVGHPLRKDFPLTGYVQVKYDETLAKVVYEPVKLDQPYREFDFSSSWKGASYILPGDEKANKHTI